MKQRKVDCYFAKTVFANIYSCDWVEVQPQRAACMTVASLSCHGLKSHTVVHTQEKSNDQQSFKTDGYIFLDTLLAQERRFTWCVSSMMLRQNIYNGAKKDASWMSHVNAGKRFSLLATRKWHQHCKKNKQTKKKLSSLFQPTFLKTMGFWFTSSLLNPGWNSPDCKSQICSF